MDKCEEIDDKISYSEIPENRKLGDPVNKIELFKSFNTTVSGFRLSC